MRSEMRTWCALAELVAEPEPRSLAGRGDVATPAVGGQSDNREASAALAELVGLAWYSQYGAEVVDPDVKAGRRRVKPDVEGRADMDDGVGGQLAGQENHQVHIPTWCS
jgi:hypothetical protein